ncbi:5'-nucleotidase [Glutamicibacter ardleyensis]|uniref:5'-nucleotidase n=1 Tax=Glutamicibacter ardleyensis TaxID=225894 RepID=UPI003FD18CA5
MPYSLDNRLVIGVASSALFDLSESDKYFRDNNEFLYRAYQEERIDQTLEPGHAFPFVKQLLSLNDLRSADDPLVEVIVLSRNDPSTGLRVMRSIADHKLHISRAVFTQGRAPYEYIGALKMSLFLSGNRSDVDAAIKLGFPAGHVLPSSAIYADNDEELRVAFDFDGVLANDDSERFYKEADLDEYKRHETELSDSPLEPGPLKELLRDLNLIQKIERDHKAADSSYQPRLRIAIVTARNAPAHERAIRSLQDWGVTVNDAFFLGGIEKSLVLEIMRPHIFFDDQTTHLTPAAEHVTGVHVPYGIANEVDIAPSQPSSTQESPGPVDMVVAIDSRLEAESGAMLLNEETETVNGSQP